MISRLPRAAGYVAGFALLLCALAVTADVLSRWLFSVPIKGLFEISELAFAAILALGFAHANAQREHVALDLIAGAGGRTVSLSLLGSLLTTVVFGFFVWLLWRYAEAKTGYGETTLVLGLPIGPFWYGCAGLMTVSLLCQLPILVEDIRALAGPAGRSARAVLMPVAALALFVLAFFVLLDYGSALDAVAKVLIGFAALYVLALAQVPLGTALALTGFAGSYALFGINPASLLTSNALTGTLSSADLAALPLFLLMGNLAISAGFADEIFAAANAVFGKLRGGHAIATVIGCAGFGAISGSSVATTATLGGVAYREMKANSYAVGLATGSIAAGGTLGALIPPSVILIIYCVIAEQPIAEAFIAALVPGLLAMALYTLTILVVVHIFPDRAPADRSGHSFAPLRALRIAWRPIALFLSVIGGLYGGLFTVQEAAAVGSGFAFFFWLASGKASVKGLFDATRGAVTSSAVLYFILIGAGAFGSFLNLAGITTAILSVIDPSTTPAWVVLTVLVAMYLLLGSVFDTVAALVVTVPFVIPLIVALNYDLIWWGVVTLCLVEIGMITPPIGMNIFILKSLLGKEVTTGTMFRGVVPFLVADAVRLSLLIFFPVITLWLPRLLGG